MFHPPIHSKHPPTLRLDGTNLKNGDIWFDTSDLTKYPNPSTYINGQWLAIKNYKNKFFGVKDAKIKIENAYNTIDYFDIPTDKSINILEIGCGLGYLSKVLIDIGHHVVSVDDENYLQSDQMYSKLTEERIVPTKHWKFDVTTIDSDQFSVLKSYNNYNLYDMIIVERNSFHLYETKFCDANTMKSFINGCKSILCSNGTLIFGLSPQFPDDFPISNGYGYDFLDDAKQDDPNKLIGEIAMVWHDNVPI